MANRGLAGHEEQAMPTPVEVLSAILADPTEILVVNLLTTPDVTYMSLSQRLVVPG